jgi:gliding motility-associated-like protein
MNDLFFPYKSAYYNPASIEYYAKEFKIQIFNRWGTLVYETTDYNPQWDGRINGNGKDASAGVYYWVATYVNRCEPNRVVVHKGFVHLLR